MSDQKVIGAGFGRTGTLSLYTALNKLEGFGPCYHMKENMMFNHSKLWYAIDNATSQAEREKVLEKVLTAKGYKSSCDYPSSLFFEDLLRMSPDAKVILSVRDNPGSWATSVLNTIFSGGDGGPRLLLSYMFPFGLHYYVLRPVFWLPLNQFEKMSKLISRSFLGRPNDYSKEGLEKCYTAWIEHVKAVVPKDQLLIFNVKQGWNPLCKFLGAPIPNEPFPRVNDTAEFNSRTRVLDAVIITSCIIFYGAIYFGFKAATHRGLIQSCLQSFLSWLQ